MIKALMVTCICGFLLAIASLGVLSMVGFPSVHLGDWEWRDDHHHHNGPTEAKAMNWPGGSTRLDLDIPADVTYTQAPQVSMVIHAPHDVLEAIRLDGDTLRFDDPHRFAHHKFHHDISVEISAPSVHHFEVSSAVSLRLNKLDLDTLNLAVSGAADIAVEGKVHRLDFSGSGASNLDAEALVVEDAAFSLSGAGHVSAGPTGVVSVDIAGLGMVSLLHKPHKLTKEIDGLGAVYVEDANGGEAATAGIGGLEVHDHGHHDDGDDADRSDDKL